MALERVVVKSKSFHITTLAQKYFSFIAQFLPTSKTGESENQYNGIVTTVLVAGLPSLGVWVLVAYMPAILVFFLYLLLLWVCLGCPVTRQTYKRYLQAANREDFEACSLYSEQFGNKGGDLSNVGKQLVLVNYRHYASVIIFFVILGLPGMVFYSLCKEWYFLQVNKTATQDLETSQNVDSNNGASDIALEGENNSNDPKKEAVAEQLINSTDQVPNEYAASTNDIQKVMFILDWLPSRITAFGFLLVGHFSRGLPVWLETFANVNLNAYDVLAKVAKASEDLSSLENPQLQEPLQMVKLVKRNIIFFLMVISVMTLVGVVS
ncbi:MAG: AmpE protein [Alphaproteobacteria bacterium]|jgi:AmpE protein